ncbi:MAG: succinate dehydrogenase, hydrophobic membrane anchor protein [Pseudomonadota bacterium]|nr:succinate dehydrogenase, hydrophobic membrane anchor protein [Pseudomonadota bacterium]QKK04795.1 MAG: succinate dehydrogenase, hydrophobic membrane anchor protein [Pseudomonadota bacterium]
MRECCSKQEKIQSPLAKARGLGSAKSGYHHWWMQRVTALALVPLSLWMLLHLPRLFAATYTDALTWMAHPWNSLALLLFLWMAFYHAVLGLEVVIEDYIHCKVGKPFMLLLTRFVFGLAGIMAGYAVLLINFG